MNETTFRALLAILCAMLLAYQALRSKDNPNRQGAFFAGAAAFGAFGLGNLLSFGSNGAFALSGIGLLLFVIAGVMLFRAQRRGEFTNQIDQMRQEIEAERARRDERMQERERKK